MGNLETLEICLAFLSSLISISPVHSFFRPDNESFPLVTISALCLNPLISEHSTGMTSFAVASAYAAAGFVIIVALNVLRQLLFRNKNEPPVVFHWIPFLGNTITYGMDPYAFFFSNREKVSASAATIYWTCTS